MSTNAFGSSGLLNEVESLLRDAGFSTRHGAFANGEVPCLVAEDEFFIVAVVATTTLDEARRAEPFAASELLQRLSDEAVGAKRWDAYLLLMTAEQPTASEQTHDVAELQYNTRGVRRLVATGVGGRESLMTALRPFLPLPPAVPGGLSDALEDLADQLILNGVAPDEAPRYVALFAETGSLDDA